MKFYLIFRQQLEPNRSNAHAWRLTAGHLHVQQMIHVINSAAVSTLLEILYSKCMFWVSCGTWNWVQALRCVLVLQISSDVVKKILWEIIA